MTVIPLAANHFEDFIDGYFPLKVSLSTLLERHGFASAWISMRVAPMMHIADQPADAPVPLYLDPILGGELSWFSGTIVLDHHGPVLSGHAEWRWNDASRQSSAQLPPDIRLAEPAFLRGIGFAPGNVKTSSLGNVKEWENGSSVTFIRRNSAVTPQHLNTQCINWSLINTGGVTKLTAKKRHQWAKADLHMKVFAHDTLQLFDCGNALTRRVIADILSV